MAYKQPVIRPDIDAIRGVSSDSALKTLLERGLVAIAGRDEGPGRPLLYRTTPAFLKYFGLNRVEDLPDPDELASILGLNERPEIGMEEEDDSAEQDSPAELVMPHPEIEPLPDVDTLDIHEVENGEEREAESRIEPLEQEDVLDADVEEFIEGEEYDIERTDDLTKADSISDTVPDSDRSTPDE